MPRGVHAFLSFLLKPLSLARGMIRLATFVGARFRGGYYISGFSEDAFIFVLRGVPFIDFGWLDTSSMGVNYSAIEMTSYLIIDRSGFTDYSVIRYPSTGALIRSPKFFQEHGFANF